MAVKMTRVAASRAPESTAPATPGAGAADRPRSAGGKGPASAPSPEQIQAIAAARQRARKVNRAAIVATVSGWTLAVFAALTLLSGLLSPSALLAGAGLAVLAWRELQGARGLRMFDVHAPHRLGWNQLALATLIAACGVWGIVGAVAGPSPYEAQLAAGGPVAETLQPIDRLQRMLTVLFYAMVIGVSLLTQGGLAAYYFTRRRHVSAYLCDTPRWIVDMLRAAAS
jgi:hypothetical protein